MEPNECALHMANKGCQLFILDTDIHGHGYGYGCVLSFGAMPSNLMDLRVMIIDWPGSHRPMGVPRSTKGNLEAVI